MNVKAQSKSGVDSNFDCLVEATIFPSGSPKFGVVTRLYRIKADGNLKLIISNASDEDCQQVKWEVLAIYDTLIQEPIEAFKPGAKKTDVALDTVPESSILEYTRPTSAQAVREKLRIGTENVKVPYKLKQILYSHLPAFSRCPDAIGDFRGWAYPFCPKTRNARGIPKTISHI